MDHNYTSFIEITTPILTDTMVEYDVHTPIPVLHTNIGSSKIYDCKHIKDYGNKCLSIRVKKMCSACRKKKSEDEQLRQQLHQAFGTLFNRIENKISTESGLSLAFDAAVPYNRTGQAWTLLGRYLSISNSTRGLHTLILNGAQLTDEIMMWLFRGLVGSISLKRFGLNQGVFGVVGLRSMSLFLQDSPELNELHIWNNRLNSECFEIVLRSLACRGGIQKLNFMSADITDISALETYKIHCLQYLNLSCNNIGNEGIMILSNLLQQEDSSLTILNISLTGSGDEEAEIVATALKHNTKLLELYFENDDITEKGARLLLKVVLDMSSIDSTYNSNHTLSKCLLKRSFCYSSKEPLDKIQSMIKDICEWTNKRRPYYHNPGWSKVRSYQLDSQSRKKQCHLQGIDCSITPFTDIEVKLLPNIFALIGKSIGLGHSEFYTNLIPVAPELLSHIDRKAMLTGYLASNLARLSSLSTQYSSTLTHYERHTAQMVAMYEQVISLQRAEYDRLVVTQGVNGYIRQGVNGYIRQVDSELLSYESEYQNFMHILYAPVRALQASHERNVTALKAEHIRQTSRLTAENVEVSRRLKLIDSAEKPEPAGRCPINMERSRSGCRR